MAEPTYTNGHQDATIEHVVSELKEMRSDIKDLIKDVSSLKTKAGMAGIIGGAISAIGIILLAYAKKLMGT